MGATNDDAAAAGLLVTRDGPVVTLTIDRPDRRNALSSALMLAMAETVLLAQEDPDVRAIIVTATGDRAFCAGADLKEMAERDAIGARFRNPMQRSVRTIFEVIADCETTTIAAVNGAAAGGGFELALACDLRVVASTATFSLPEAGIGMGANFASALLPRLIPRSIAFELLATGRAMDADEAMHWGLANRVVEPGELQSTAADLANQIAGKAPLSVARMKALAMHGVDLPLPVALRSNPGPDPYRSDDRREGTAARREGRPPEWKGR